MSITVIRHQQTQSGFIQAINKDLEMNFLQLYTVHPDGRTVLDHSEAWATEEGVISAFNESVKAHRDCDLLTKVNLPKDIAYVIELARHRADMWADFAETGFFDDACFHECDADEVGEMSDITDAAVSQAEEWLREVRDAG